MLTNHKNKTNGGPCGGGSATIFIVEDDELVRESLCAMLEAYGFAVRACRDGQAFLDMSLAVAGRRCVLLDIKLPGMSGYEVLDALNQRPEPMPPVILMTGGEARMAAGALACLRKPLRPDDLVAAICGAI